MEMTTTQKTAGISGFVLKMTAVVTMLIDHTAASILERIVFTVGADGFYIVNKTNLYYLYMVMRTIGRMAFPIYCFLLVEGFVHTKNVKKYAFRLFLFALISELPFDMALFNSFWDTGYNNVFWTLFIGLVTIAGLDFFAKNKRWNRIGNILMMLVVAAAGMLAAEFLHTDYGMAGVATIVMMYIFKNRKTASYVLGVIVLTLMGGIVEAAALLMAVLLHFYNGTRGRQAKYFFYAFYPAHLLVLAGICALLGLGI